MPFSSEIGELPTEPTPALLLAQTNTAAAGRASDHTANSVKKPALCTDFWELCLVRLQQHHEHFLYSQSSPTKWTRSCCCCLSCQLRWRFYYQKKIKSILQCLLLLSGSPGNTACCQLDGFPQSGGPHRDQLSWCAPSGQHTHCPPVTAGLETACPLQYDREMLGYFW